MRTVEAYKPVVVIVIVAVIVDATVIVAVHLNGNATVDVIARAPHQVSPMCPDSLPKLA